MNTAFNSGVTSVEQEYSALTTIEHRKKFAQFFTPFPFAELMTQWILGNTQMKTVLEPAFGLGIFSRSLLSENKKLQIKGYEIDEKIFNRAKRLFASNENVELQLNDYIFNDWENKYDGIICNPPYFKFHDYENKSLLEEVEKRISFRLNGFTNLYALFLLKSLTQLNSNGRAAYIVPSEFLNSDYGKLVKSYLIKNRTLRHVIVVDFEENVFDDALTTSSILFFANDEHDEYVRFTNLKTRADFENIEELIERYPVGALPIDAIRYDALNPDVKWRRYYQTQNSLKFKNLVPFNSLGKVSRGIATGSNEYFIFTKSKARSFDIPAESLLPCICRSSDVKTPFFTRRNFVELEEQDRPVFLLKAENKTSPAVEAYLAKGVSEGIDKKFLTASRKPWFSLEKRPPSAIWVSVFNRGGLKFIRNEADVSNLTTFHSIYVNIFAQQRADLFFAYLLTNASKQIFEDNRREYGNGLQKFEPNDINNSKILDLDLIDTEYEKTILKYFKRYRDSISNNQLDETSLTAINNIFVERFSVETKLI